jgi:hypothetical protein
MSKRLTLPVLSPERRRDLLRLSGLSYWATLALQREHVGIDCRLDDDDLAVQQKLNPEFGAWRYHADRPAGQRIERFPNFKPGQALKKRATLALEAAIRPRRTGKKRPTRYSCAEITAVVRVTYAIARDEIGVIVDTARLAHHRRPLTLDEHRELARDRSLCRDKTDWRHYVSKWLKRQ